MNLLPILLFLSTFFIYSKTLCPTVFWRDTGEFLVAANGLGIPHSPGTPIYPILGRLFSLLPIGTIPFRINLMSAFFASLSVVLLYFIILKVLQIIISNPEHDSEQKPIKIQRGSWNLKVPALVCSLLFAFSHPLWFYGVVAEVYTLQQALTAGVLFASLLWIQRSQLSNFRIFENSKIPILLAYLYGLSLTNHGTGILLAPSLLFLIFVKWLNGNWLNRIHNSLFTIFHSIVFLLLPLTLYLYLPIRSARDPFLDWGDPESLSQFWRMLTAQEFQVQLVSFKYALTGRVLGAIHELPLQYGRMVLDDFTFFGLLFSLIGVFWLGWKNWRILVFTGLIFFANLFYGFLFGADLELDAYLLSCHLILSIWIGCGIYGIMTIGNILMKNKKPLYWSLTIGHLSLPIFTLLTHYPERDLSGNEDAKRYILKVTGNMEEKEIFLTENSVDLFLLYYLQSVEREREDIVPVYVPYLKYSWHREQINEKLAIQNANFEIEDLLTSDFSIDELRITNHKSRRFSYTPLSKISLDPRILHPSGFVFEVSNEPISPEILRNHELLQEEFERAFHETPLQDYDTRRHFRIVHSFLGELFFQRGMFEEAEREYLKGIEIDPEDEDLRLNLGLVYEKEEKWDLALKEYEEFMKGSQEISERMGRVFLRKGVFSQAIPHLKKALSFSSSQKGRRIAEIHYNLGMAYLKGGSISDALYHNEEAVRLDSTFVEAYNNLGISYREQNDTGKALTCFEKSIEIDPRYVEGRYNLGMTYFQLGRIEETKTHFQILVKDDPENTKFSEILDLIESRSN